MNAVLTYKDYYNYDYHKTPLNPFSRYGYYNVEANRFVSEYEAYREETLGAEEFSEWKEARGPANIMRVLYPEYWEDAASRMQYQTLMSVQWIYDYLGYENIPQTYEELTDTDKALSDFRNIMYADRGVAFVPVSGVRYSDNPPDTKSSFGIGAPNGVDMYLPYSIATIAVEQVWRDCFFDEKNIASLIDSLCESNAEADREFLCSAIKAYESKEREIFDATLERTYEIMAQLEAETVYTLFNPSYNIAGSENDADFQAFKASYKELMKDMYDRAMDCFYTGFQGDILTLSDGTYDSDRKFNVGGKLYTKRELDETRRLHERGEYYTARTSEDENEKPDSGYKTKQTQHQVSLNDMLIAAFVKRYKNHKMDKVLEQYEKHILYS